MTWMSCVPSPIYSTLRIPKSFSVKRYQDSSYLIIHWYAGQHHCMLGRVIAQIIKLKKKLLLAINVQNQYQIKSNCEQWVNK